MRLSWGGERERGREWWRGVKKVMHGQPKCKKWRLIERLEELLTTGFDKERKKESWSMLKVIWPGVVKHFSCTCSLCPWVYTAGCYWFSALSQSRAANAVWPVSQCQTFNAHIQSHRAYICHYKRTFIAQEPICHGKMLNAFIFNIPESSSQPLWGGCWTELTSWGMSLNYTPRGGLTNHKSVSQDYISVEANVSLKWFYK